MQHVPGKKNQVANVLLCITPLTTLMARCASTIWWPHLPWILHCFRTTPKESFSASPNKALYGKTLALPADFFITYDEP
ncbi:hypothetical protein SK128_006236, partial [Halocaridina rubra]